MAKRKGAQPADLMSLQACADKLTEDGDVITRSGLSRYIADYPSLVRGKGPRNATLVSYKQVREHRAANDDREAKSGRSIDPPAEAATGDTPRIEDLEGRRRERRAKAALAELDLAEKLGLVVERAEVEAGMAMCAGATARKALQEARDIADQLAADIKLDPGQVSALRVACKQLVMRVREIQSEELKRFAGQLGDGDAAKEAAARLEELIELARTRMPGLETFKDSAQA